MRLEPTALNGFFEDLFGKPMPPATTPGVVPAVAVPAKTPSVLETLTQTVQQVLPGLATTVLAVKQQRELNKINVARAQAGQAPLDISQYQEASAPVIKVQGGVDSRTGNNLMIAGLGVGAALALVLFLRNQNTNTRQAR